MNVSNLDNHISMYYQAQQLSETKLSQLLDLADNADTQEQQGLRWLRQRNIAIAAMLLVFTISIVKFMQPAQISTPSLARLVSQEIALNHEKRLAPEFIVDDYRLLTQKMTKLDFNLIASKRINSLELKLVGARYCSIHGQLATQLKLVDAQGVSHTLYQTLLNDELSRLPEDTYLVNGVKVEQWQEGGLFFGFAENM